MRKFFILILFIPFFNISQYPEEKIQVTLRTRVKSSLPRLPDEYAEQVFTVNGSVYLVPEFELGKTLKDGILNSEVKMRYNAFRDNIEILGKGQKPYVMVNSKEVEAILEGKTYRYINFLEKDSEKLGYLNPLNNGETVLFKRTIKIISDVDLPDHGYENTKPPSFVPQTTNYIKRKNRPAKPLLGLSRKEVFAVLWDKYSELRKYAKENKLHLRTEAEVIQVLNYYDELIKNEKKADEQ